jgi:hypothetical protein
MKKNHTQEKSENPSTQQSPEQLDLFEWALLAEDSPEGFAVRNGL